VGLSQNPEEPPARAFSLFKEIVEKKRNGAIYLIDGEVNEGVLLICAVPDAREKCASLPSSQTVRWWTRSSITSS